jgi:hypothetical protein
MRMSNIGKQCLLDGCNLPSKKKGYCETHYQRFRVHGDATKLLRPSNYTLINWIKNNVSYSGSECLIWPFSRSTDGRGQIYVNGKNKKANRIMCEMAHGSPPTPTHQSAHSCGNGHLGCIHPLHLRWATRKENAADKLIHGTKIRGELASNSKLTTENVIYIREQLNHRQGKDLAVEFNVHAGTISRIKRRVRWTHI